jgi:hypothetical protein
MALVKESWLAAQEIPMNESQFIFGPLRIRIGVAVLRRRSGFPNAYMQT